MVLWIDEKTAIAARSRRYPGPRGSTRLSLFFSALPRRVLRHGDFSSRDDLSEKLEACVIGHNEAAKPYRWTYEGTPLKAA